jgi:outer membrane protein assembly factor BamB
VLQKAIFVVGSYILMAAACAEQPTSDQLQNWHQWRGPLATGEAPLSNPPTNWGEHTNVKWKVEIPGLGHATPIIWGDRIFILSAIKTDREVDAEKSAATENAPPLRVPARLAAFIDDGTASNGAATDVKSIDARLADQNSDAAKSANSPSAAADRKPTDQPPAGAPPHGSGGPGGGMGFGPPKPPTNVYQFVVLCLDRKTGKTLWQQTACEVVPHEGTHPTGSFASASPITDGKRVYCYFGSRGLYAYDLDGKPVWQKTDFGKAQIIFAFGEGSSPALCGDTLVVNWDEEGPSYVTAIDAGTGQTKWKIAKDKEDEHTTWATPLIVDRGGKPQVIINGKNRSRSYDLASGGVIWECGGQMSNPIPTPLVVDDLAYCVTGFRGYAIYAIPLDSTGDITDSDKIAWHRNEGTPYVSSPLALGGRLFYIKDRSGIMTAVDARSGDVIIDKKRLPDALKDIYASPVGAAGRVYFLARSGDAAVIDATASEIKVLAENHLDDTFDASPAIVGKELYLRGEHGLYCIAE